MKVLIAEDETLSRLCLKNLLAHRGFEVVEAADGLHAWELLQGEDGPRLAIFDWMMPELDGLELCRRVRAAPQLQGLYIILLTALGSRKHLLQGLKAGANDFVTKPFDPEVFHARVAVAAQVVQLQADLARRVRELEEALAKVKQLQDLLPICCYCKKIRDDRNYWHQVEQYVTDHFATQVTSGICPDCWEAVVKPEMAKQGITPPEAYPQ
ncbi:MAG: response regulator transcription factor [Planctomycetes bacterium]|nr:response regulator transcription factor [Planctomycetota bacterium]